MTKELPWQPNAESRWCDTACVNFGGDLGLYAAGFQHGAQALLNVVRTTGHDQDLLVYPIVYSLRHAVELALKQVIRSGRQLIDDPGDFPDGHRLNNLWFTCKPILTRIWPADPAYTTVESAITRLCDLDPEGDGFRYPVTTKRKGTRAATLDRELRHLDLGALVADVVEALDLIGGAETGIDVYRDAQQDMLAERRELEREMRAEYEAEMAQYREDIREYQ